MPAYSMTGSKFEIGLAVLLKSADFSTADLATAIAAGVEVKEPKTFGTLGDEWQSTEFGNVTDGRVRTYKTLRKGVPFEYTCALEATDPGQLAMRAAWIVDANYAMRFTFSDKPVAGASPRNSTRTFVGMVLKIEDDASGELGMVKFTVQPNSNIIVVNASPT
jgi:hypothetical protein